MRFDVDEAHACAVRLLANHEDRLSHARATVRHAEEIAPVVGPFERGVLLCAAWLHDIGYADGLRTTGFHPLDGAIYLLEKGWSERLCALVAHHNEARMMARALGLGRELERFPREVGPLADALVHADMSAGPHGQRMSFTERLDDMERRHQGEPPALSEARAARRLALIEAVQRTEHRLYGLRSVRARSGMR